MRLLFLFASIATFTLTACIDPREDIPDEVIGLAPIYAMEDWAEIKAIGPQPILNLGKLYYKSPYLYATDRGRGIHVIDNTNPETPVKVGFIQIAGNSDVAVRGNTLYANNVADLIAMDISNLDSIQVLHRLEGAFEIAGTEFPEGYVGYFECVDPELGQVVGWYETTLNQPQCWR